MSLCLWECLKWQPLLSQQLLPFLPLKKAICLNKSYSQLITLITVTLP